jgi:hypothetical protein
VSGFFAVETVSSSDSALSAMSIGLVLSKAQALEFLETGAISDYPGYDFSGLSNIISKNNIPKRASPEAALSPVHPVAQAVRRTPSTAPQTRTTR